MSFRDSDPPPLVAVSDPTRAAHVEVSTVAAADARRTRQRLPGVVVALAVALIAARLVGAPSGRTGPVLRLDGHQSVYLSVSPTGPGTYRMLVPFRLLNRGRSSVTVLSAAIPGSLLRTTGPADPLDPGATAQLVLEQPVTCRSGGPPVVPVAGARMSVRVRADGVDHPVALALPPEPRSSAAVELNRLCGWVPVPEAVRFVTGPVRRNNGQVVVALTVFNSSAQLIRLTGLGSPSPGLRSGLQNGRLPVELRPSRGPWPLPDGRATFVHLDLVVGRVAAPCTRAVPGTLVLVTADHGPGTSSSVLHPPDDRRVLAGLLSAGCR